MDRLVDEAILTFLEDSSQVAQFIRQREASRSQAATNVEALRAEEAGLRDRIRRLEDEKDGGLFDYEGGDGRYAERKRSMIRRLRQLQRQVDATTKANEPPVLRELRAEDDIRGRWAGMTTAQQRLVRIALISAVEIAAAPRNNNGHSVRRFDPDRVRIIWVGEDTVHAPLEEAA